MQLENQKVRFLRGGRYASQTVRLIRNVSLAPAVEWPRLILKPFSTAIWTEDKNRHQTNERQAEQFRKWVRTQTSLVMYNDDFKNKQAKSEIGSVVYRRQQLIAQGCDMFDAEIKGTMDARRAALAHQCP